ncbi:hypothetical protein HMPREF1705_03585 [Acetomicrobium hydrogeniformans ATCC BAA-1850]|uniref:Uncharacterized protein n=2 Tax=Acetomicrobium hydrogeniformans TaxID=649746 RepID=A0A0T5XF00_9BACT|nr:hypothetical protein HMPREF1705_03585 [Acetomicrobium hydrogeniformans ATCC BAA-1850]
MANVVAVAAGIAPCVEEVMEAYAEAGGEKMEFVKEACGPLANKIAMGAPYDMFLASEPRWPKWLKAKGMLVDVHAFAVKGQGNASRRSRLCHRAIGDVAFFFGGSM